MVNDWIVIGISGVTCGGKTTLANRLKDTLVPVYVFHQDKYFYADDSPKHVRCPNLEHNNYDILSALDMDKMTDDVTRTMRGENRAHSFCLEKAEGKWGLPGKRFLILEGFTVLNHRPLLELCHLRYYFVLEYGECAARRALRLYDPPDTPGYFEQCVWPEHLRYKAQIEKDGRVKMLDGTIPDSLELVLKDLSELGASRLKEFHEGNSYSKLKYFQILNQTLSTLSNILMSRLRGALGRALEVLGVSGLNKEAYELGEKVTCLNKGGNSYGYICERLK